MWFTVLHLNAKSAVILLIFMTFQILYCLKIIRSCK